ncbi:MAG: DEAD/DEAH box helicase, partial [Candidatus Staskawiczbacteria bacterium]
FTFATIGSVYLKSEQFSHFKTIIIDECHLVNPKNLDGMFTQFLQAIGNPKCIGFTATPYRMDSFYKRLSFGYETIVTIALINRRRHHFWHRLIYNINNEDLLKQGYLCPLEYIDKSIINQEDIPLNKSRSDFDLTLFEKKIEDKKGEIFEAITLAWKTSKSILVFCSSVEQANELQEMFKDYSEVVTAKTNKKERKRIIDDFRSQKIPIVFNVGVLTIGFDHPALDCIVLLRPTRSIALYYQMIGRGVRVAPGKTSCKVIDLTSNVKNLGRVETIKLEKKEGKWELLSETGSWHNAELYRFIKKQ